MSSDQKLLVKNDHIEQVKAALGAQHAVHSLLASVVEDVGYDRLVEWGDRNPGRLLALLVRVTPSMMPMGGFQGDINLTVNENLLPTELDEAP